MTWGGLVISVPTVMILQHTATRCGTLQHTAIQCNTLQHTATHCNTLECTAVHCNMLQYTATHCNALQYCATHCNTLQHTASHCITLQHTAAHCNTLQHSATPRHAQTASTLTFLIIFLKSQPAPALTLENDYNSDIEKFPVSRRLIRLGSPSWWQIYFSKVRFPY